jgi:hypothetical protein
MDMKNNKHAGSSFDSFLRDEKLDEIVELSTLLTAAEDALQAVVSGGDKDSYWSIDWEDTYLKARKVLRLIQKRKKK